MDWLELIDIYRAFNPETTDTSFFSSAHGTFSMIDHILGHKSRLDKIVKNEIISSIFSDHNTVRLDVNYRKKYFLKKPKYMEKIKSTLLNNQKIIEETKKEIKICLETNDNKNTTQNQ